MNNVAITFFLARRLSVYNKMSKTLAFGENAVRLKGVAPKGKMIGASIYFHVALKNKSRRKISDKYIV